MQERKRIEETLRRALRQVDQVVQSISAVDTAMTPDRQESPTSYAYRIGRMKDDISTAQEHAHSAKRDIEMLLEFVEAEKQNGGEDDG